MTWGGSTRLVSRQALGEAADGVVEDGLSSSQWVCVYMLVVCLCVYMGMGEGLCAVCSRGMKLPK
jgi:hypothetical protein